MHERCVISVRGGSELSQRVYVSQLHVGANLFYESLLFFKERDVYPFDALTASSIRLTSQVAGTPPPPCTLWR